MEVPVRNIKLMFISATIMLTSTLLSGCKPSYTVSVTCDPPQAGKIQISPAALRYDSGTTIQVEASANEGYYFTGWKGNVTPDEFPNLSYSVDSNSNLTATFKAFCKLTVKIEPPGCATVSPSEGIFRQGENVTLTPRAEGNYLFDSWGGDAEGNQFLANVTMNGNKTVIAHFMPRVSLTISVSPKDSGMVAAGDYVYNEQRKFKSGQTIRIKATPFPNYQFVGWSGDETGNLSSMDIKMDKDKAITAVFEPLPSGSVILADSFDDNQNKWMIDDKGWLADGVFNIKLKSNQFDSRILDYSRFASYSAYGYELEIKPIQMSDKAFVGLVFCDDYSRDGYEAFYAFVVTRKGSYSLIVSEPGGLWLPIIPFTYSIYLQQGSAPNILKVVINKNENFISLYANGHFLGKYAGLVPAYQYNGFIGYCALAGGDIETSATIDNLRVRIEKE
jgi:hypothetical protein